MSDERTPTAEPDEALADLFLDAIAFGRGRGASQGFSHTPTVGERQHAYELARRAQRSTAEVERLRAVIVHITQKPMAAYRDERTPTAEPVTDYPPEMQPWLRDQVADVRASYPEAAGIIEAEARHAEWVRITRNAAERAIIEAERTPTAEPVTLREALAEYPCPECGIVARYDPHEDDCRIGALTEAAQRSTAEVERLRMAIAKGFCDATHGSHASGPACQRGWSHADRMLTALAEPDHDWCNDDTHTHASGECPNLIDH